uniref:RRM domain-containing protein n=1 Tax=Astyanax mexicanus TaxID=7994 RepID=A0A8B9KS83_ASTMX
MAEFGNGLADESLLDSDPGHPELEDPGVGDEEPGLEEGEAAIEDPELEAIKARVREMEEEAEKLKELQNEVEKQMNLSPPPAGPVIMSIEEKMEADGRSIYVGNVDYGATAEELEAHFHGCGSVNRVTILCDKFTGHPKGLGPREQIGPESAPQTAGSHGPASAHAGETSPHLGLGITAATRPLEAEDGPSGAEGDQHRGIPLTNTPHPPSPPHPSIFPLLSPLLSLDKKKRKNTPLNKRRKKEEKKTKKKKRERKKREKRASPGQTD